MEGLERAGRRARAPTARRCSARPSASSTAPRSRPTRCSSARARKVGLLTTEGHRDVIEMREGLKDDRYNLRMPPPEPLVPRARRLGVRERMRFDGSVEIAARPRARSTRAIAACSAQRRRGGRRLLPARLPRRRGTSALTAEARARRAARASTSRSPPRCCRRSRSTSGSARRWSTPTSGRRWRATWPASRRGCARPAIAATC